MSLVYVFYLYITDIEDNKLQPSNLAVHTYDIEDNKLQPSNLAVHTYSNNAIESAKQQVSV